MNEFKLMLELSSAKLGNVIANAELETHFPVERIMRMYPGCKEDSCELL